MQNLKINTSTSDSRNNPNHNTNGASPNSLPPDDHNNEDEQQSTPLKRGVDQPSSASKIPPILRAETNKPRIQTTVEAPPNIPLTVEQQVNAQRPRTIQMQYRFLKSLFFALSLFSRLIFWDVYVMRWLPSIARRTQMNRWKKYARGFSLYAISMGGVMIKLGQFASTRADILPEEIVLELANLQDEVPSVPYKNIKTVIETEIGRIENHFAWIDETPVAAASLGQVHRAQLKNGDRVVVKVQRPNIRDTVYTDLAAIFIIAKLSMRMGFINRRADMVGLSEEFGRVLLEEISYEAEVRNAKRFGRMFKDNMGVYIPSVYGHLSTDKVIVLEDVTTIKINDYERLEASGIDRKAVAKRLLDTYMHQIFEERFFHADPHPGNLFVYPLPVEDESQYIGKGGRPFYLIFVDFGMTGTLTVELTQGIIKTLEAVITQDADKLVRAYQDLGFLLPDADTKRIKKAIQVAFNEVWGMSMADMRDMDFERALAIGEQFNDLLYDLPFRVPQDFIYLGRTVGILSGMSTALDPDFNPWSVMQDNMGYLIKQSGSSLIQGLGESLKKPMQAMLAGDPKAFFESAQSLIIPGVAQIIKMERVLQQIADGDIEMVTQPSLQHQRQLSKIESQSRRTTRAILFVGFLITATMLYTNGDKDLATLGYIVSALSFISLVMTSSNGG